VVQCSSLPMLVGKFFYQSLGRKSFTFPQVFYQNLSAELSIFNSRKYL